MTCVFLPPSSPAGENVVINSAVLAVSLQESQDGERVVRLSHPAPPNSPPSLAISGVSRIIVITTRQNSSDTAPQIPIS